MRPFLTQYWHAEHPPDYVASLISSFSVHNQHMNHRVFNRDTAQKFIALHFTERERAAFSACAVPAMQADYFRYCAMLKLGGICSDADTRCVRTLQHLIERAPVGLLFTKPNGVVINGFFAFRAPEHPLIRLALEIATVNIERKSTNDVWSTTGPGIFTLLACLCDAGSFSKFHSIYVNKGGPLKAHAQNVYDMLKGTTCVETLFEGILVLPVMELRTYIRGAGNLPYKASPEHWLHWQEITSIYSET